jgi:hypothetical protein
MIINGGSRRNGKFFAKHLGNAQENERVTLCEIRNLAAETVAEAFREMEAIAMGTRCENYFYHANINPLSTETLTQQQWSRAIDLLEAKLCLAGNARFIVEHQKKGRVHRHVVWLRIDVSRMRAVEMTDDYERHQATARELEVEFGLVQGKSVLGEGRTKGERPARRPQSWETFRGHLSGIDPQRMTDQITSLYRSCNDASEFASRLREQNCRLVRGDRTGFCIVDSAGHVHSLARRLPGVTATALEEFLGSLGGDTVPTVAAWRAARSKEA